MDDRRRTQGLKGLLFIAAGVLLLGSQTGWWEIGPLLRWWPVALIAIGLHHGVRTRDGFLWIGWGLLWLSWATGVWTVRESWPLLLVLYGVALVVWPACSAPDRRDGSRVC